MVQQVLLLPWLMAFLFSHVLEAAEAAAELACYVYPRALVLISALRAVHILGYHVPLR